MYECLTVDLFNLHHQWPSMHIVLASMWSLANIYPHMQIFMTVWNKFTMQHKLG